MYDLDLDPITLILQESLTVTAHLKRSSPRFSSAATSSAVSTLASLRLAERAGYVRQQHKRDHEHEQQQVHVHVQGQEQDQVHQIAKQDETSQQVSNGIVNEDDKSTAGTEPTSTVAAAAGSAAPSVSIPPTASGSGHHTIGALHEDVIASALGTPRRTSVPSTQASSKGNLPPPSAPPHKGQRTQVSVSTGNAPSTSTSRKFSSTSHFGPANSSPSPSSSSSSSSPMMRTAHEAEEVELLAEFMVLKRELNDVHPGYTYTTYTDLSPISIILPFLNVIRSPLTSGSITALALTSLHTFVVNLLPDYLPPSAAQTPVQGHDESTTAPPPPSTIPTRAFTHPTPATPLQLALSATTSALARCKFPSASPAQDELVLLKLLKVAEVLVTGPLESELTDEAVCEILEVGLGMGGRARLSEGLRKTAQSTVQAIVHAGFTRLKKMDPRMMTAEGEAPSPPPLPSSSSADGGGVVSAASNTAPATINGELPLAGDRSKTPTRAAADDAPPRASASNSSKVGEIPTETPEPLYAPYGLPTLVELFRVLISLLNPNDLTHTDSMRLSALTVLNTALEVGGKHIGQWDDLLDGLKDEGCRYLFQLIRSDNIQILILALRTTSTLFSTLLPHFKLQFELFLTFLIDRLTPSSPNPIPPHLLHIRPSSRASSSPRTSLVQESQSQERPSTPRFNSDLPAVASETKELMLETLTQLMRKKSFMVDLWVNYDCDLDSEDMFERIIDFLTRGVYPTGQGIASVQSLEGLDSCQTICFEALLSFVEAMNDRMEEGGSEWNSDIPVERLMEQKSRKAKLLAGVEAFNAKPKKGVAFLYENNLIPDNGDQDNNMALAKFLRHTARLDKKVLGEYISQPDNIDLLKAYIGLFDFQGKSIADAMRDLLEAFRLPGEAQPISRITETFAEHFASYKPPEIANQDAAYILAYSVIMLNTDQHNPQNRRKMTIEDYQKNLRGVNDGKDFAPEYLAHIHDSIRQREIIMPQEHVGQAGFDYAWKGLMIRSKAAGPTIVCNTSRFDLDMFNIAWRPVISAIASAFTTTSQDEYITQKAISGFRQCATMAGRFKLPEVIDSIVLSLSYATGLLEESAADGESTSNFPVVERDGQSIVVSPLSIRFGTSFRSQLATIVLFTIANGNGDAIREGWHQIFEMFQTLFMHSLLPPSLSHKVDFLSGSSAIPLKVTKAQPARDERRAESGLLSTLSSYLLSPYGSSSDALTPTSDEDVENTLSSLDCVAACRLDELYEQIHHVQLDSLVAALQALRSLAESRCLPRGRHYEGANDMNDDFNGRPMTPAYDEAQQPYDPGCVFDLELMISLATHTPAAIAETWPIIFEFISMLLGSAQLYSVLLIERAVVGLLKLCMLISDEPKLRDQLFIALDVLRSLPSSVLNAVSEQLMAGIAKILEKDRNVVRSQTEWGLVIALFRATVAHPEASKLTLDLVQKMSSGNVGSGLTADNFGGIVALLDEFATSAGAAASRQLLGRRGKSSQPAATLGPTVERGLSALDSLYDMRTAIAALVESSSLEEMDAWNTFWLPPLLVIGKHCVNACKEIRQRAVGYLQRLLLSPQLIINDAAIPAIFVRILFPIIEELLKAQVYERDPTGVEETRLRASTLLCKVFLQYLPRLAKDQTAIINIMLRVIDLLERFMRTTRKEQMLEAVPESLKNVILVMHSSGLLQRASTPDTRSELEVALWFAANDRINKFLPGFMDEVIPPVSSPPAPALAPAVAETEAEAV